MRKIWRRRAVLLLLLSAEAFRSPAPLSSSPLTTTKHGTQNVVLQRHAAAVTSEESAVFVPQPGKFSTKISGKTLNVWGGVFALSMTTMVIAMYPLVLVFASLSYAFDVKRRRLMDAVVAWWARLSMLACGYRPRVTGLENLPAKGEAVLYAPNHCSYLDILTLSGFLRRPIKYVSKIEILRIPLIGWAMAFAGHVALRRSDRRSQLETFKAAVESLQNGNSIVAFPEGTRSLDGRLQSFKRGPFKMAEAANVDVVPVVIKDLHKWHPSSALMPLGRPRDVEIAILPRLSTKDHSANELLDASWTAMNNALPAHQRALNVVADAPAAS